jgi:hypothetical protein
MSSVGYAHAILKGRLTGDVKAAKRFLETMSPQQRVLRNRLESRARTRKRKGSRLGDTIKRG